MDVPLAGLTKGLFEIFIPGVFLFLNLALFYYNLPYVGTDVKQAIDRFANNPVLGSVVILCFGYLSGMLLRLCKTGITDLMSGVVCSFVYGSKVPDKKQYFREPFPYFNYIKTICEDHQLPDEARDFFTKFWSLQDPNRIVKNREGKEGERREIPRSNRQFFNYCKVLINTVDKRNAMEIYSAEAMTRYISGMNYALIISLTLSLATYFFFGYSFSFLLLSGIYFVALWIIMINFRYIRFKEVETVFAAVLVNYEKYKKLLRENPYMD